MPSNDTSHTPMIALGGSRRVMSGMVAPARMPATRVDVLSTGTTRFAARVS